MTTFLMGNFNFFFNFQRQYLGGIPPPEHVVYADHSHPSVSTAGAGWQRSMYIPLAHDYKKADENIIKF